MDAKQVMYAAYDKYISDHRLEDTQAQKAVFVEGYYQGMKFASDIWSQEAKQEIKEDR